MLKVQQESSKKCQIADCNDIVYDTNMCKEHFYDAKILTDCYGKKRKISNIGDDKKSSLDTYRENCIKNYPMLISRLTRKTGTLMDRLMYLSENLIKHRQFNDMHINFLTELIRDIEVSSQSHEALTSENTIAYYFPL